MLTPAMRASRTSAPPVIMANAVSTQVLLPPFLNLLPLLDETTIVIPDRPGNNRLDSLQNILENPHAAAIFIIPGAEWTLRVNGRATIIRDEDILERSAVGGKRPALGINNLKVAA